MTSMIIPFPISAYSNDPVGDALSAISGAANISVDALKSYIAATPSSALVYNDPILALGPGHGTGVWQFKITYREDVSGQSEPNFYIATSAGNSCWSNIGLKTTYPPNFATPVAFTPVTGRIFAGGSGGGGGGSIPGNASLFRIWMDPTPWVLSDMIALAASFNSSGGHFLYCNDPQINVQVGTGIWCAKLYIWAPSYVAQTIIETGGCSLSSNGRPNDATSPPAFNAGWTQLHSLWRL